MSNTESISIVLIANTSWYLWNFRRRLAAELSNCGFRVIFVAPDDGYSDKLRELGQFCPIRLSRQGKNPIRELMTIRHISRTLTQLQPDVVLAWTPKLNLYCGLVSRSRDFQMIPNVAGLGAVFIRGDVLARIVGVMYRLAFAKLSTVFFQNPDDMWHFSQAGWVKGGVAQLLPGSGVDLDRFRPTPLPGNDQLVFMYGGRLLADKGLPQLIEASRLLRENQYDFQVRIYGPLDPGSPSGIDANLLAAWEAEQLIDYRGSTDRMEDAIGEADCVVLPSFYREGIPRILLEAAASGRPIITTNSVGCRDAIEAGKTGLMCEPRDAASLAAAMEKMMLFSPIERERMAKAARKLAESKFDERIIVAKYLAAINR